MVSTDRKALTKVRDLAATLDEHERERVHYFTAEEMFAFLGEMDAHAAAKEETVMGYKVKVRDQPLGEKDQQLRKQSIFGVMARSLKRLGGKKVE